jgi:putative peptidoglycan lipid II flippase
VTGPPAAASGASSRGGAVPASGRAATLVAAGILLSRIFGLVRQKVFGTFFGAGDAADAFSVAFRIPNILQNLFGEGVLSASFIPVYAGLRARGDEAGRRQVAGTVLSLLLLVTSVLVLVGISLAPVIVTALVPSWTGEKRALTVMLVRILFPGGAIFVLSAWTLGILNSHGRFFLSYVSGVFWNIAMITTLLLFGARTGETRLATLLAWGSVAGALLQFAVQLPSAKLFLGSLRPHWAIRSPDVQTVLRNFLPVLLGRGVAQVSGLSDAFLAGFVGTGAVATLTYAQAIYMLPVSLFGMSVSAAELPAMSSVIGHEAEVASILRQRLENGLRRIAFFVVPSAVAFFVLGDQITEIIYLGGKFGADEVRWVWAVLAGAAVGLVASTLGRLYASAFYALRDTRTPLRFAVARVAVAIALGAALSLLGPRLLGIDAKWGVAGITIGSGAAGWLEFALLRRTLGRRIGRVTVQRRALLVLWAGAALAALVAFAVRWMDPGAPRLLRAGLVLALYGMVYWVFTWRFGVPEAIELRRRIFRR